MSNGVSRFSLPEKHPETNSLTLIPIDNGHDQPSVLVQRNIGWLDGDCARSEAPRDRDTRLKVRWDGEYGCQDLVVRIVLVSKTRWK